MGFVDHQNDPSATFVFFCGEQALGLGDQLGPEAARHGAQALHDVHVQTAGTHGRVGQVDEVMRGLVQLADGSAYGEVLPTPTSPVMTPSNASAMQKRMRATAS